MSASPMQSSDGIDTLIIGAGMSGLAAAIRLAQYDQRVVVLERHSLWGGLNSFYKQGGRHFDVGLHALTNYTPKGARGSRPLPRILRQLRLSHDDLRLGEQVESLIAFGGSTGPRLRFSNGLDLLRSEIERAFPGQIDSFERLVKDLESYPAPDSQAPFESARARLASYFGEQLLIEMLLAPICYYGSPHEGDVAWDSFGILFKSLYEEGFSRPAGGVRTILDVLRNRLKELGGELRLRSGVARILHGPGGARGVVLDNGTELRAKRVISSAGWVETMALCGKNFAHEHVKPQDQGRLSFVESISVLDRPCKELGHETTIVFFNDGERLVYERPEEAVDYRSGVICCPDNYQGAAAADEGMLRLTLLANYDRWMAFDEEAYASEKSQLWNRGHAAILPYAPDIRPHAVQTDVFTPRTIERFTGHLGGAVYGSPNKRPTGLTPIEGLFLCGTDQGYLGIVGAMLSGIAMANVHALVPTS